MRHHINLHTQLNRHRNQIAHESQSELARLLLKPSQHENFERFRELFPILYGSSVQDLAAQPNEYEILMTEIKSQEPGH